MENSEEYENPWVPGSTPFIQFPELRITSFRGATSYKFNSNYSLNAISSQTEIQLKSAGSFIPGLVYNYYVTDNQDNAGNQSTSQKSKNLEVLANLSYFYTFVLNKTWYAALGFSPSIGVNYTKLLTRFPDEYIYSNSSSEVYRVKGAGGMGYNSERFFAGFEITAFRTFRSDAISTVQLVTTYNAFQAFVGYRFDAPKKIQELAKKAQSKIPL